MRPRVSAFLISPRSTTSCLLYYDFIVNIYDYDNNININDVQKVVIKELEIITQLPHEERIETPCGEEQTASNHYEKIKNVA